MNLRQVKSMMIGMVMMWGITGCGSPMSDGDGGGAAPEKKVPVAFQNERLEDIPEAVRLKKEELEQTAPAQPTHTVVEQDGTRFVVIATAQKPTGGYTIRVNQVIREADDVTIHAEEVPPPEDQMAIQALTTPVTVISVDIDDAVTFHLHMKEAETEKSQDTAADSDDALSIQSEPLEALPSSVKEEAEALRTRAHGGEKVVHHDGRQFIIIALGERRTGGYHVEVEKVDRQGEEIHVYAREVGPEPGMMVTQALTYPLEVVSFRCEEKLAVTVHMERNQAAPDRPDR